MRNVATDQLCGLGRVTPPHWASGDKGELFQRLGVHTKPLPRQRLLITVSEQPNPETSHPVGLSPPPLHGEAEHELLSQSNARKHFLPALPVQARELCGNRFAQAESTDTRRTLQVYDRPLPTRVHACESTSKSRQRAHSSPILPHAPSSSPPSAPAHSAHRAGFDYNKESNKEKGKRR